MSIHLDNVGFVYRSRYLKICLAREFNSRDRLACSDQLVSGVCVYRCKDLMSSVADEQCKII